MTTTPQQRQQRQQPRLGIDIGRVIIDGGAKGADTAFFGRDEAAMLATPEVAGAADAIASLVDAFDGQVWLVSKCGPNVQARTLRWLDAHDWYHRTGIDRGRVRFCRQRPEKRDHCLQLGLTHFVDDHPEVHRALRGAVRHAYLFGAQHSRLPDVEAAPTWVVTRRLILATLPVGQPVS